MKREKLEWKYCYVKHTKKSRDRRLWARW